jgi:hypothetical protein
MARNLALDTRSAHLLRSHGLSLRRPSIKRAALRAEMSSELYVASKGMSSRFHDSSHQRSTRRGATYFQLVK